MKSEDETPHPIAETLLAKGYKHKKDYRGRSYHTLQGRRISRTDYTHAWIDVQLAQWREDERAAL